MQPQPQPRVFVTQVPTRRDPETGAHVPAVNIAPAEEHGAVTIMMPAKAHFYATADLVVQLRAALREYDFERGDSLVALGDPAIIAVACAILGKTKPGFNVLKWDRNMARYQLSRVVV